MFDEIRPARVPSLSQRRVERQMPKDRSPKVSESRFRQSVNQLRTQARITKHLPDIVMLLRDFDVCLYCNMHWYEFTAMARPMPPATRWHHYLHPKDRAAIKKALSQNAKESSIIEQEGRLRAADGSYVWHLIHLIRLDNKVPKPGVRGWLLLAVNVHDRKIAHLQAKLEVSTANKQVQQAQAETAVSMQSLTHALDEQKSQEIFVQGISHDLRSPLTIIDLGLQRLQAMTWPDRAKSQRILDRVVFNVKRANAMLDELLIGPSMQTAQISLPNRKPDDLAHIVDETVKDLAAVYRREVSYTQSSPIEGLWDCTHIRGLIDNLVSNAFKYGDTGRDVTVHLESRSGNALLRVHNFGEAIASSELQAIFKPFYRSSHPRDAQQIGWGMGLSMVATLAHVNFGHVVVTSDTTSGTTFMISLPILHE